MAGDNVCHVCGATFTRPQHVGRHMRSHTGDKPYHCKECPEKFARSDLLSRHVNKTHGPAEGEDAKGNGRNVVGNKTKGRKPKFKSAAESLSNALGPGYVPPFSNLPQASTRFQQPQYGDGQQLPYNLQAPFPNQSFQQPPQYGYVQTGHGLETVPNPSAAAAAPARSAGMPMATRRDELGAMYTVLGENGGASGYEVDNEEDAGAWIDIPHNPQAVGMMGGHKYAMPQPFNTVAPSYSQIATHLPAQVPPPSTSMITSPYVQPFDSSLGVNHISSTGNADHIMSTFSTGYSPAMMAMQNPNASSATTDSSPFSFWSGSNTQSPPSNSGQPGYQQPMHPGASGGPILSSSTSPYSFDGPSLPRQSSDSPAMAGLDIMHTKGNSPLAPAPGGMTSLGAIPTTYSSIMPAPLVPAGTPLADQVEKIKKRACESCNHSKVKCDFQTPCGKCASRKISCVYPTARKSSRKANMSGSPLSQGAGEGSKPNSASPAISTVEFKPVILSSQIAQNQPMSAFTNIGLSASQGNFEHQQANGHLRENFGPQQLTYMANPANPQSTTQSMVSQGDQFHPLPGNAMTFAQIRQAADEDGESIASGYTYGQASIPDSRRSSLAAPFESRDDQQVSSTLPFGNLSLGGPFLGQGGSVAPDVQQWLAHPSDIDSGMDRPFNEVTTTPTYQNGLPNDFPRTTAAARNLFWQNGAQPGATLAHAQRPDLLTRPGLMRGRSNSFPSLFTPRGDMEAKQYFAPHVKDVVAPLGDQSALPSDWTAQIKHLTTQLNRNGSGSSSLQQVDDTLATTSQSSPQANEPSPEALFLTTHPGIASGAYNQNRPSPAVIQSAIPNAMSQQFMAGRGSLQTLAPERTASFLNSTPSVELDGMAWQSANTSKKPSAVLQSPFKMPNHLARPGNKRLASQTLGPDAQKRQPTSSTEYDLAGHSNMLAASANQVTGLLPFRSDMYSAPISGRRASVPAWLPDSSGSQGLMQSGGPNTGTSLAFPHTLQGGNPMNYSPGIPSFCFSGLTPTTSDPMQGFNFNSSIDMTTPTVERVTFNPQTDDGKPGSAWPIQT